MSELVGWHEFVPTFALGAGFRFWTKISVKETFFLDDTSHIEFKTEVDTDHNQKPHQGVDALRARPANLMDARGICPKHFLGFFLKCSLHQGVRKCSSVREVVMTASGL